MPTIAPDLPFILPPMSAGRSETIPRPTPGQGPEVNTRGRKGYVSCALGCGKITQVAHLRGSWADHGNVPRPRAEEISMRGLHTFYVCVLCYSYDGFLGGCIKCPFWCFSPLC